MFTLASAYFIIAFVLLVYFVWTNKTAILVPETRKDTIVYCLIAAFGYPLGWRDILSVIRVNANSLFEKYTKNQ